MSQDFKYEQVSGASGTGGESVMSGKSGVNETNSSSSSEIIINLSGDLMGGVPAMDFQTYLNNLHSDSNKIIFDCSGVGLVNSSGLGMLVAAHTHLKNANKTLILCSVGRSLSSLVKMTHLDKVFIISDNCQSAAKL